MNTKTDSSIIAPRNCLYPVHPPDPVQRIRSLPNLEIRGILDRIREDEQDEYKDKELDSRVPNFAFNPINPVHPCKNALIGTSKTSPTKPLVQSSPPIQSSPPV